MLWRFILGLRTCLPGKGCEDIPVRILGVGGALDVYSCMGKGVKNDETGV